MATPVGFPTVTAGSALLASLFLFSGPLAGQRSTTRGLHLGFHLQGARLVFDLPRLCPGPFQEVLKQLECIL